MSFRSGIPFFILAGFILLSSCQQKKTKLPDTYPDVAAIGAMKNVMWKGELRGIVKLDTLKDREGLYGLGPLSYLSGELLINNGTTYVSTVAADSSEKVEVTSEAEAPFFVYGRVKEWKELKLPDSVTNGKELEVLVDVLTKNHKRPFVFKLAGNVESAEIHIQNLPEGTKVSSPKEAHQGQMNYPVAPQGVEIIGFFSTEHQGVFTHHDSYVHMHLITSNQQQMGHLDAVRFQPGEMTLYLPVK